MRYLGKCLSIVLAQLAVVSMFGVPVAWADEDSASQAAAGFARVVPNSTGLVIRVPINDKGEENTNAAEMKLWESATLPTDAAVIAGQYSSLRDAGGVAPQVDPASVTADSSTWGWRHGWSNCGWQQPWYYQSYHPTYYWGGNNYNYNYYSGYSYYYPSWGYRYYFYRPYW